MTKHQTLAYIKYGKLISEINNKIKDSTIDDIERYVELYQNDFNIIIEKNE